MEDYKSSIKEVYIEDGVTSVGSRAFAYSRLTRKEKRQAYQNL